MCGLAGWLGTPPEPVDEAIVLRALRHRGPDGTGARAWADAGLLHTRLKIIDLSPAGAEPMANEDESVFVVFNGEIYNHRSLRQELEARGHVFHGACDAEVLPHLYEEHGSDLFGRLRGMFSVAIYDAEKHLLLLGRDRFGIKPLFYGGNRRFLAFASELNALRLVPGVDLTPDRQAISDYAAVSYVPAPRTLFRGLAALEPGTLLEARLQRNGELDFSAKSYHRWSVEPRLDLTLESAVEEADNLVEEAVARQLESDVPLGALLSGGIDSSLVSAAAWRGNNGKLQTFNVGFADPAFDETAAAVSVARHVGSDHQTLEMPDGAGSWEHVTTLLRHTGQPFGDTSLFAVDAVTAAMRRHVTVALSGDGGDEAFGGYDLYGRLGAINRVRRLPRPLAYGASSSASLLAALRLVRPTLPGRFRELNRADDTTIVESLFTWIRAGEHRRLVRDSRDLDPPRRLFERTWNGELRSPLERLSAHASEVNTRLVLPNDFLFKVDSASMRHSLEVRVPMLDEKLVAFGLALPHALRASLRHGGKLVLRGVAQRRLPPEIASRRKQGFGVPVDRWVDGGFRENLRELIGARSRIADYLDSSTYQPWVDGFCSERAVPGLARGEIFQRIVMLVALELQLSR